MENRRIGYANIWTITGSRRKDEKWRLTYILNNKGNLPRIKEE